MMVSTQPKAWIVTYLFLAIGASTTDAFSVKTRSHVMMKPMKKSLTRQYASPLEKGDSSSADISSRLVAEWNQFSDNLSIAYKYLSMDPSSSSVSVEEIVNICDCVDQENERLLQLRSPSSSDNDQVELLVDTLELRKRAYELGRYHLLVKLMKKDYSSYLTTAAFLSPSRIDRLDLPNVQDVPLNDIMPSMASSSQNDELVDDCKLEEKKFNESILDQILLKIFRNLVTKNTNGLTSSKKGIDGLLEQGRNYMLQPNQTAEAQHKMVKDTLGGLMTPVLPPFYRIFMSGIVPKLGISDTIDGKQFGPWFYAPWLTTIVTPTFFGFLVGPSRPNRRKDGERGGLVVEKCKFLQESNCKGLCLHQCKIPAQEFFKQELGLDLTVSPNFATQECQWSFGEVPLKPEDDPSFPKGCIVGCGSREEMANRRAAAGGLGGDSIALSCN